MRRVVLCAAMAIAASASALGGVPPEGPAPALAQTDRGSDLELQALSRFGGAGRDGRIDGLPPGFPREPGVFPVLARPAPEVCAAGVGARWTVDGRRVRPSPQPAVGGRPCEVVVPVPGEGDHEIEVEAYEPSSADEPSFAQSATITIDDKLVVALGDSVASGEGNPEPRGGWVERRCHRGSAAGFEQAARLLGAAEGASITFVSLACSGAGIDEGLLEDYGGVKPDGVRLAPQVDRLARIADAGQVDAVLISVGANDIGFADVAAKCALPGDCRAKFEDRVAAALKRLPGEYDRLARPLRRAAPKAPVLISEYFDPTHDREGDFCRNSVVFTTEDEARWAYESLLRPLNAAVGQAATRNGWTRIGGIAGDFGDHGICARGERWVLTLQDSLGGQGDQLGTLHPNGHGQTAIASRVAPPLAVATGLVPPAPPPKVEPEKRPILESFAIVVGSVLLLIALGFLGWLWWGLSWRDRLRTIPIWLAISLGTLVALPFMILWRMGRLARATSREPPAPDPQAAPQPWRPRGAGSIALVLLGVLVAAGAALLFAREIGRAILWVRYWAANLPASQSVDAVSNEELLSTGSQALGIFLVVGMLGLIGMWLLDRQGTWGPGTRLGLIALVIAELLVAVLVLGDFPARQAVELLVGFLIAAPLAYFLIDRSIERATRTGRQAPREGMTEDQIKQGEKKSLPTALGDQLLLLFGRTDGRDPKFRFWLVPLRALPPALLVLAVVESFRTEATDRLLWVLLPCIVAAFLFVAPGGIAWKATADTTPDKATLEALEPPRVALALAGFICICVLVFRDEQWLFWAATIAIVLAFFCLGIAAASGPRFAPLGLAVLVSVPLFGAAAVMLRGIDSPELQPVAAVLEDGRAVCGVYIGDSDGQLWIGHAELPEQADVRRPTSSRSSITPYDDVREHAIGTLQPVARATSQARALREQLAATQPGKPLKVGPPTCAARRTVEKPDPSRQLKLAERFQPELVVDREDPFWPIGVTTLFAMQDRRAAACRQVRKDVDDGCVRLTTQGEFPWAGGEGEAIEYPATEDEAGEQHDLMVDALVSIDPARTAREYFLLAGDVIEPEPITMQYWFFYSFNYQPLTGAPDYGGFHEGDFESIAILLSGLTRKPRYIWMARHAKDEGRVFPWDDDAVSTRGDHPVVFAARGSHATYENCNDQVRLGIDTLIDDHPACEDERPLVLEPEVTPLTDLSRVSWGCWHGLFGHRAGSRFSDKEPVVNNGPLSPLWQQEFGGVEATPCAGIPDPGGREGQGEEVLDEAETGVPALLRERAARLDTAVDDCSDWEVPASAGIYMVACNQRELSRYAESGFEDPGTAGVRIDVANPEKPRIGELTLPAVRRQPTDDYLDAWRITAAEPTEVSVYASCRQGLRVLGARFELIHLEPGDPLQLADGPGDEWRLLHEDGTQEGKPAKPVVEKTVPSLRGKDPGSRLACSAG